MTLPDQIKLIDTIIADDPEVRIIDYLDAVHKIDMAELIKNKTVNTPKKYTLDDALFMMGHAQEYTARQMAIKLRLDVDVVYNFGVRNSLQFKPATKPAEKPEPTNIREAYAPDAPKKPLERAKGVYNNIKSNYL